MKKIIIIFIIAFCLLCFVGISCLAQASLNYGEFWNSLSDREKTIYFIGMRDGIAKGGCDCAERFSAYMKEEESRQVGYDFLDEYYQYDQFLSSNRDVIIKVISDLYKDPANTYIYVSEICFLAYRKLKGESIESSLMELRKEALP